MSVFTTTVRNICQSLANMDEIVASDINTVVAAAQSQIFDDYDIYDENHRAELNCKILKHYFTREIGEETFGLWKFRLNQRMDEIMPYYNELYRSADIEYNPLHNIDITKTKSGTLTGTHGETGTASESGSETFNASNTNSRETESSGSNSAETSGTVTTNKTGNKSESERFSDTPQGSVDRIDLENNAYLTKATLKDGSDTTEQTDESSGTTSGSSSFNESVNGTDNKDEEKTTSSSKQHSSTKTISDTESSTETVAGYQGSASYAALIKEYRTAIINVDVQIIDELSDLFLNIYE